MIRSRFLFGDLLHQLNEVFGLNRRVHAIKENIAASVELPEELVFQVPQFDFLKPLIKEIAAFLRTALKIQFGIGKLRHDVDRVSEYSDISISFLTQLNRFANIDTIHSIAVRQKPVTDAAKAVVSS